MQELIKQHSIDTFVKAREQVKDRVLQINELFKAIDAIAKNILDISIESYIRQAHYEWDRCQKDIDYYFWRELLQRGMITNVMTDSARNKYLIELRDHAPDFNLENISGLVQNVEHLYKDNAQ